jgi:hypothetical protein
LLAARKHGTLPRHGTGEGAIIVLDDMTPRITPRLAPRAAPIALVLVAVTAIIAGCAGGSTGSGGADSPAPAPSLVTPITTPEGAVAAVVAQEPRFAGIGPLDPDLIGQSAWYEVTPASGVGAFLVTIRIGWGDCMAGCIEEHTWVYAVAPDGTATLQSEAGDTPPDDAWPAPSAEGRTGVLVTAVAGPVCPVERVPPDPACAPKPVAGAPFVIRQVGGSEVATGKADGTGAVFVELPAGDYEVQGAPVAGLMGAPAGVIVTVADGRSVTAEIMYDTGIR